MLCFATAAGQWILRHVVFFLLQKLRKKIRPLAWMRKFSARFLAMTGIFWGFFERDFYDGILPERIFWLGFLKCDFWEGILGRDFGDGIFESGFFEQGFFIRVNLPGNFISDKTHAAWLLP